MKRIHAFISGRVQGVSFRYYARRKGGQLNLTGWVRNLYDGRVETVAEGPPDRLEDYVRFLHSGSPAAEVTGVEFEWQAAQGDLTGFEIRW
jgi:acylphosphatase